MEDKSYCNCCINQGTEKCEGCYQTNTRNWTIHINFYPKSEFRSFFYHGYIGDNSYEWMWNSRRCDRPATKSVDIHNKNYCPYCACLMFPIQNTDTLKVAGYTCFCEGATAELEYEADKDAMLKKHEKELAELKNKYRTRLTTDLHTLFNIKQEQDRKSFEFFNKDAMSLFSETKTFELEDLIR